MKNTIRIITLVTRQDYFSLLKVDDWVGIQFSNGIEPTPFDYMVGSIDEISRGRTTGTKGAVTTTISLSGRDIGKQLLKTSIVIDPLVGSFLEQTLFNTKIIVSTFSGGRLPPFQSPSAVALTLLKLYFGGRFQCAAPMSLQFNARTPADIPMYGLDVSNVSATRGLILPVGNPNVGGNVWSTIEQFANLVINEMFVDTLLGCPALVMRNRQWSHDNFAALSSIAVDAREVPQENFSKSGQDIRNWFRVYPDAQFNCHEYADVAKLGYVNSASLKRSGLARLEPVSITGDRGQTLMQELEVWVDMLAEWNYQNDKLLAGTLTTRFRPDAHIGQRLDYTNERTNEAYSFYIEALTHNYVYPGASTTQFTLTRGTDRVSSAIGPRFPALKAASILSTGAGREIQALDDATAFSSLLVGASDMITLPPGVA